jgi:glutamyl-tRNA synthetase
LDDAAKAMLTPQAVVVLAAIIPRLQAVEDWGAAASEAVLRAYAEENGLKLGAVAQPLRAALTGKTTSPPIFDVLAVLGKDESLARLRDRVTGP